MEQCPCGTGIKLEACCNLFISGKAIPATPEELMRSRYTAYTQANIEYVSQTMKVPGDQHFDDEVTRKWAKQVKWLKLEVKSAKMKGEKGYVEFLAHYSQANTQHVMHEIAEFHKFDDKWFYVDSETPHQMPVSGTVKIGRNDSCSCGSNKKYKKCCGVGA